jgi:hypothetical protein
LAFEKQMPKRLLAKVGGSKRKERGITHPCNESEAEVERAKRSGGLHKRSAEGWGDSLRARGENPLRRPFGLFFRIQHGNWEARVFLSVKAGLWFGTIGILVLAAVAFVFGGLCTEGTRVIWNRRLRTKRDRLYILRYGLASSSERSKTPIQRFIEWVLAR